MFAFWSLVAGVLQGAAAGCRWKVLVRMVFALLSLVAEVQRCCQNAVCALELGCWCRCRVPLQGAAAECCLRFGPWLPAPLQGAAARGCCLRSGAWLVPLQGVAGCCWRVLLSYARCRRASLQGAAMSVRVLFALWSLVAGAAAMCCCRVLFRLCFEAWLLVPL